MGFERVQERNMMTSPLILVTNDDGIDSPGLHATAKLLNVNVPRTATAQTPFCVTIQSQQNYYHTLPPPVRSDLSTPYRFFSQIHVDLDSLEPESDIYAFSVDRVISVTPLQLNLTACQAVEAWKEKE
jgi:broad specificity polyphosphatase/5'/3'-nucleotidase SurE